jgi:hypothetical protein
MDTTLALLGVLSHHEARNILEGFDFQNAEFR